MSITGDIYNIDQSLTGEGITDLELNSLLVDGTFQKVDASYFNNISSNIQTQLNNLSTSINTNANLNYAFLDTNNIFTGSLNKFVSIDCSNNFKTLYFNGYQASFLEGATSNLQQQINSLTSGSPINGQSATISIGTTSTLEAGSNASVTNSGTNLDAVLNFGIPRGLQGIQGIQGNTGNNGITPTFTINPIVDNLVSGTTPYVTITQNPTNNYILKFGLVQGAKGDKGDKGDTPTQADILSIITAALGGIGIAVLAGYVTVLQGEVVALQGQVAGLETGVATLVTKTTGLSYTLNASNFSNNLSIGINAVILSTTGTNYFTNSIQTSQNLISKGITIYDNVDTGTIKAFIDDGGNISINNLTAIGDIISIGTSTSSQTYLQGTNIQIGCSAAVESLSTISIGKKNISSIFLHGEVNIATDETSTLSNINIGNGENPINIKSNIIQSGTTTTTLLDTSVKSLSVTDGDIIQSSGTSTLYNLDVIGPYINIGDNNENNVVNIGNNQSTITLEGDSISIGVTSVANTINIGNSFTTLTLRSNANEAINIENIMDQMDMDINEILNEINGF